MYTKSILFCLLLFPFILKSQVLELAIQDEGRPISNCSLVKNGILLTTNTKQLVSISVQNKDLIIIQHEFYIDFILQLPEGLERDDTLNMVIELTLKSDSYRTQNLDEFIVSGSKYQNIFDNKDEFIIDYFPFPTGKHFVITRLKGNYYIKIIGATGNEETTKQIAFKPREIFLDAMGNFHLITKDSVFQLYTENDSIHLLKPIPKYMFDQELGSLVTLGKKGAFHQTINKHNQLFTLSRLNNGEMSMEYQVFHSEQYKMAVHYYSKTVDYYMRTIREGDNVILMGIWDGDLMTLNTGFAKDDIEIKSDDSAIIKMIGWSKKIASKPLNVKAYGLSEEIIILDGVNDSIVHIDNEFLEIKKVKAQFTLSEDFFHDYFYDKLYMFSEGKGGITVYKINTDDGILNKITQITDIHQPRNIKILNDTVFFTVIDESGFNRIIKVN